MISCYLRIDRRQMALLKFILEAYEGLAVMSSAGPEGLVRLRTYECSLTDLEELLEVLRPQLGFTYLDAEAVSLLLQTDEETCCHAGEPGHR